MADDTKEEFKKLLSQTIDENLKQIFRETATQIICQFLENNYSLKREEIPEKLETFIEGLQKFFRSGAHMIEQSILKELHSNLGLKYKSREGYRFVDYIDDLENVYQAIRNPLRASASREYSQRLEPTSNYGGWESLSLNFLCRIFPVVVLGISESEIKSTDLGFLNPATFPLHHSIISFPVAVSPSFKTTTAFTVSPQTSSGTPITATSKTLGC